MRSALWRAAAVVLLCLGCATAIGRAGRSADLSALLLEDSARASILVEETELSVFLLKSAILSSQSSDIDLYLDEVLALLTGMAQGGLSYAGPENLPMIGSADALSSSQAVRSYLTADEAAAFFAAMQRAASYFRLAETEIRAAISLIALGGPAEDLCQKAYAYLAAALGDPDSPFELEGVVYASSRLPSAIAWVDPGESIQAAIDDVGAHGYVYLSPGEYHESVVVRAPVRLAPSPLANGDVTVRGVAGRPTVQLEGTATSTVYLIRLRLAGGHMSVAVSDRAVAVLEGCVLEGSESVGLYVSDDADVQLLQCAVTGHRDYGILAEGDAHLVVSRSAIGKNGDSGFARSPLLPTAGVCIRGRARVSFPPGDVREPDAMTRVEANLGVGIVIEGHANVNAARVEISGNLSDGLLLLDSPTVTLSDVRAVENGGYGLRLYSSACPGELGESVDTSRVFIGTLRGFGNQLSTAGSEESRAVCPLDYRLPSGFSL